MHKPKTFYRNMAPERAERIRELYFRERMKQKQIADMYGIKQNTVSRIISDLVWTPNKAER